MDLRGHGRSPRWAQGQLTGGIAAAAEAHSALTSAQAKSQREHFELKKKEWPLRDDAEIRRACQAQAGHRPATGPQRKRHSLTAVAAGLETLDAAAVPVLRAFLAECMFESDPGVQAVAGWAAE